MISSNDTTPEKNLLDSYIQQMNDKERKAYEIAKDHLQTSFNISKSIGFIEWKKKTLKHGS